MFVSTTRSSSLRRSASARLAFRRYIALRITQERIRPRCLEYSFDNQMETSGSDTIVWRFHNRLDQECGSYGQVTDKI